jgi:hypothetical protein
MGKYKTRPKLDVTEIILYKNELICQIKVMLDYFSSYNTR